VHPTTIISGYKKALDLALNLLNKYAITIDIKDKETIKKVVLTSMASKSLGFAREHLADIAIDAVLSVVREVDGKLKAEKDDIQIIKKEGKSLLESELVKGIVVDKEVVHSAMPKRIENARIALIDAPFEIEKTEFSAEIRIRDPSKIKEFLDEETAILKKMVDKVISTKANVVFCQKGIDDVAQFFMAKAGIMAVRRVKQSDMEKLSKATGAKIVTNVEDLTENDLGYAGLVEELKIGEDRMVFVRECKHPKAVSILIRAGLERQMDEAERALNDAIFNVINLIENNKIVPGGGAIEAALAMEINANAGKLSGREQLAFLAYAEALEIVPKTLAENAGLDPIEIMTNLRSKHKGNGINYGINVLTGNVEDMVKKGIVESLRVKEQTLKSSFEAASMLLRIDDVVAASRRKEEKAKTPSETMPEY
ncbi:MAG: thermosome subunit beta, partial [Nitrososphaerota archaeon]